MSTSDRAVLRTRIVYAVLGILCLAPLFPVPESIAAFVAPVALLAGAAVGLTLGNPDHARTHSLSKTLLQASVVLLGFSMDFAKVAQAGKSGFVLSLLSIGTVLGLGWLAGRFLKIRPVTGFLVSVGTAICGGSAIAAVSSVVDAEAEEITVAVGTVFLLNAVALLLFPPLGHLLHLTQTQFGEWSGIAIHDIASVASAGAVYGRHALDTAVAVKLSRVLYLVPVTFAASWIFNRRKAATASAAAFDSLSDSPSDVGEYPETTPVKLPAKTKIPWFVGFFLLASVLHTVVPALAPLTPEIKKLAAAGFALCLFLIGAGLTRHTLKAVGVRPLVLGCILWAAVSLEALVAVTL